MKYLLIVLLYANNAAVPPSTFTAETSTLQECTRAAESVRALHKEGVTKYLCQPIGASRKAT